MKTAIIFGANGQDGYYLGGLLETENIRHIGVSRKGDFLKADTADRSSVADLIRIEKPDYIFHFAANSTAQHHALFENHHTIATGTLNILEAVKDFSPHTKVFLSGSALQFQNEGKPIKETDSFSANDAYAVSRIQSVYAARYFRKLGLQTYVGYFFNHDSPMRTERHIAKKISAAAQRIAAGSTEKLQIGDLAVIKEWGFAGDAVRSVWQLVNNDKIYECNIATGTGYSVKQWADACFGLVGLNAGEHIVQAPGFVSSYKSLVADNSFFENTFGAQAKISFEALAAMMMQSH